MSPKLFYYCSLSKKYYKLSRRIVVAAVIV